MEQASRGPSLQRIRQIRLMNRDDLPEAVWKILQQENEGADQFYDQLKTENAQLSDIIEQIRKKDIDRIKRLSFDEND
tara:strand:+ start:105 stop:338 length:234 start_codon:yes stop_codon:yes gene_type:complete